MWLVTYEKLSCKINENICENINFIQCKAETFTLSHHKMSDILGFTHPGTFKKVEY